MLVWQALTESLSVTFPMVAFLKGEEVRTLASVVGSTELQMHGDLITVILVLKEEHGI